MSRTTKKLLPFLIFLILGLTACREGGDHLASYTSNLGFGYQYDSPENYCRTRGIDNGFEQYCPEGRIEVVFLIPKAGDTPKSVLLDQIAQYSQLQYSLKEIESLYEIMGIHTMIYLAEQETLNENTALEYPVYLAVLPFDAHHFAIVSGYLYNSDFEDTFRPAFRITVLSLRPYEPEKEK